jgi:hypothetical protein
MSDGPKLIANEEIQDVSGALHTLDVYDDGSVVIIDARNGNNHFLQSDAVDSDMPIPVTLKATQEAFKKLRTDRKVHLIFGS